MYQAVTHDIEVRVEPFFLPDQSDPEEGSFVWAYRVIIANHSPEKVTLVSRYWHITDGLGRVQEVHGQGVVGEKPEIQPGSSFRYTSSCPLATPSGIMVGHYTMRAGRGDMIEVDIPAFSLDLPGEQAVLN